MFLPDAETRIGARSERMTRLIAPMRVTAHAWVRGERDQLGFTRQARNIQRTETERPLSDGCKSKG
jgi:hypothetical protein